jgi:hypothetical protein
MSIDTRNARPSDAGHITVTIFDRRHAEVIIQAYGHELIPDENSETRLIVGNSHYRIFIENRQISVTPVGGHLNTCWHAVIACFSSRPPQWKHYAALLLRADLRRRERKFDSLSANSRQT